MRIAYSTLSMESPVGPICLTGTAQGLCGLRFGSTDQVEERDAPPACLEEARWQLTEYFQGLRTVFDIPLLLSGTDFQLRVWRALSKIPYGQTISYKDLARSVGNPRACRAVGGANNKNPVAVIIPCHRVIGHDGQLVGYGSGVWRKKKLLELEGVDVG